MAIVILAGLLGSIVLNMLVLPALYLRFGEFGRRAATHLQANPRPASLNDGGLARRANSDYRGPATMLSSAASAEAGNRRWIEH